MESVGIVRGQDIIDDHCRTGSGRRKRDGMYGSPLNVPIGSRSIRGMNHVRDGTAWQIHHDDPGGPSVLAGIGAEEKSLIAADAPKGNVTLPIPINRRVIAGKLRANLRIEIPTLAGRHDVGPGHVIDGRSIVVGRVPTETRCVSEIQVLGKVAFVGELENREG